MQVTWLPVSIQLSGEFVFVFQNRIHRSAVPPPDARRPWTWGDQVIALTAALCSQYFRIGWVECWFQMKSWMTQASVNYGWILPEKISDGEGKKIEDASPYPIIISTRCKFVIIIRPLQSTNLKQKQVCIKNISINSMQHAVLDPVDQWRKIGITNGPPSQQN